MSKPSLTPLPPVLITVLIAAGMIAALSGCSRSKDPGAPSSDMAEGTGATNSNATASARGPNGTDTYAPTPGGPGSGMEGQNGGGPGGGGDPAQRAQRMQQMVTELNLTQAQQDQIKQIRSTIQDRKQRREAIMQILTPEQQEKFKAMRGQGRGQHGPRGGAPGGNNGAPAAPAPTPAAAN